MKTKLTLLLILVNASFLTVINSQNVPTYVPTNGLAGWYPFSNNAMDSSGNGNHGTVTGASLASDRFSMSNRAYSYNGSGNKIAFSNKFPFHDTGSRTLSIWVKLGTITNSAKQGTIIKSSFATTDYNRFNLYIRLNLGMALDYRTTSSNMSTNIHGLNIRSGIAKDVWQHVVYTRVNNVYRLYINGTFYNSSTDANPSLPTAAGWVLGDDPCGGSDFVGILDDVGIWNRVLSDAEIVKLYESVDMRTGIGEIDLLHTKVYPVPSSDVVNLEYDQSIVNGGYRVSISTVLSQVVYQKEITGESDMIQLNELGESGVYLILIYNSANQVVSFKRLVLSKS